MKQKMLSDNEVVVSFKATINEELDLETSVFGWGFSIAKDDRSAFIDIGTKRDFDKKLDEFDGKILSIVIEAIQHSSNEIAQDILEEIREGEIEISLNGKSFSHRDFIRAEGYLGESENKNVKHYKHRIQKNLIEKSEEKIENIEEIREVEDIMSEEIN